MVGGVHPTKTFRRSERVFHPPHRQSVTTRSSTGATVYEVATPWVCGPPRAGEGEGEASAGASPGPEAPPSEASSRATIRAAEAPPTPRRQALGQDGSTRK